MPEIYIRELPRYYILEGHTPKPVDEATWFEWRHYNLEQCRVGLTDITPGCHVSTVFLGMDHRLSDEGDPVLFETMVFGGPMSEQTWRYCTWDGAELGHKQVAAAALAACKEIEAIAEAAGAKA